MAHEHLEFLKHGERNFPPSGVGGVNVPSIIGFNNLNKFTTHDMNPKSHTEKLIDVVDYLQSLGPGEKAGIDDIFVTCMVDLEGADYAVLDSLKNNPKVEIEDTEENLYFKYRANNRLELLSVIDKVKNGIPVRDISDCYPGISVDIEEMILCGDVMACKNKEAKDIVLFPRGPKFLTPLSGSVTAYPMRNLIRTSDDLTNEVRRGDAVYVGENWYRVASAISSTRSNQPERAKAPLSVSSIHELSERNVYIDEFSSEVLPLDGDFDGTDVFTGSAFKFGCTNDIRAKWHGTVDLIRQFKSEKDLEEEMLKHNLISQAALANNAQKKALKPTETKKAKPRKRVKRKFARITNMHLEGTDLSYQLEDESYL